MKHRIARNAFLLAALGIASAHAAPPNDDFAAPTIVTGFPATASGSNLDATLEENELTPQLWYGSMDASVWFRWTAPTSRLVQANTIDSDFDTMLAVWTGATLDALSLVGENGHYEQDVSVLFNAVSGTTYHISVYGLYGAAGTFDLKIAPDTGAIITGTVTGPDGATPLPNITVIALRDIGNPWITWSWIRTAITDAHGHYALGGLMSGGMYRVEFSEPTGDYISEFYNNAAWSSAEELEIQEATITSGIDASLAIASKISGKVTGPDGSTPLAGIHVEARQWDEDWWQGRGWGATDAEGNYTIGGLSSGIYRIAFFDWEGQYINEVYDDAADMESGTDIDVPLETTVTNINASLAVASRISGSVTGPDGTNPLADINAAAYRWSGSSWDWWESGVTDENGDYEIGGLPAGTYRVEFNDWYNGDHLSEFYDDAADLDSATDIIVPATSTVTGINASLATAAKITGTVTGPDEITPLSNIQVTVYMESSFWWLPLHSVFTDQQGNYTLGSLVAGVYRLRFHDGTGTYATEVYDNAPDIYAGTDIILPSAMTLTGINASLSTAARISGTVTGPDGNTPRQGISVFLYLAQDADWAFAASTETDENGDYTLGGLLAGTYRISFSDSSGDMIRETYDDAPDVASGTDINVIAGETRTGINASLAEASKIAGTVTGPDPTTPLEGIQATAYRWSGSSWLWWESGITDTSGDYLIGGLPAGTYRVVFNDWAYGDYISEFYDDAPDLDSATDIPVPATTTINDINATLAVAGKITGTVTGGADGTTPLASVSVWVYEWNGANWQAAGSTSTDVNGTYTVGGLPSGTYRVGFSDFWSGNLHEYQVYDQALDLNSGTDVSVSAGATVLNINATLLLKPSPEPAELIALHDLGGGTFSIAFTGTSGIFYQLQEWTPDITEWQDVEDGVFSSDNTNTITRQTGHPEAWWRLRR